jgi:hypothetical protein
MASYHLSPSGQQKITGSANDHTIWGHFFSFAQPLGFEVRDICKTRWSVDIPYTIYSQRYLETLAWGARREISYMKETAYFVTAT